MGGGKRGSKRSGAVKDQPIASERKIQQKCILTKYTTQWFKKGNDYFYCWLNNKQQAYKNFQLKNRYQMIRQIQELKFWITQTKSQDEKISGKIFIQILEHKRQRSQSLLFRLKNCCYWKCLSPIIQLFRNKNKPLSEMKDVDDVEELNMRQNKQQ